MVTTNDLSTGPVAVDGFTAPSIPAVPSDFWSTNPRAQGDTTRDIAEFRYYTQHLVNYVTFQVASFPHIATVEYFDDKVNAWFPVLDLTGRAISASITNSVPGKISAFVGADAPHPQHFGAGHWLTQSFHVQRFTTQRIRIILVRQAAGVAPVDQLSGGAIPYSLGLRQVDFGYRIYSDADIPRAGLITTEDDTIASSTDYLGSRVDFSIRTYSADNAISGGTLPWRCEPQPISYAVVNYFLDVRDDDGNAQVIDRFYTEPLTTGPHMTVYYSNDVPTSDFVADDDPLPYPVVQVTGEPTWSGIIPDYLDLTSVLPTFIDVDNAALQWDMTRPWWVGLAILPQFDIAGSTINSPIIALEGLTVRFFHGSLEVVTPDGEVFDLPLPDTPINAETVVIVGYTPALDAYTSSQISLFVQIGANQSFSLEAPLLRSLVPNSTDIRIGGFLTGSPIACNMRLRALMLKQEALGSDAIETFVNDPQDAVLKPSPDNAQAVDTTLNAVLRFSPASLSTQFPTALVGGPGQIYSDLTWTPIARDYTLQKGYLQLPPTKAKFFKFEFTNLIAQQYEVFVPITQTVQVFSTQTVQAFEQIGAFAPSTAGPGWSTMTDLNPINRYYDALGLLSAYATSTPAPSDYSPTSVLVANDLNTANAMEGLSSWIWDFDPWQTGSDAPRFVTISKHFYETITVTRTAKTAYFVGLNVIRAYRESHLIEHDRARYYELFQDSAVQDDDDNPLGTVDSVNNFTFGDSDMQTPDGLAPTFAQAVSISMPSTSDVRGIQFATTQSDVLQINPDDQLVDIADYWTPYGDGDVTQLSPGGAAIQRGFVENTYDMLEGDGAYSDIENLGLYGNVEGGATSDGQFGGGIQSTLLIPSSSGRLYAAVRVVTQGAPLTAPIIVQILSEDEELLAQDSYQPGQNDTATIIVPYSIGSVTDLLTYGDAEGTNVGETVNTYEDLEAHDYGAFESTALPSNNVFIRVLQEGATNDNFIVQRASLFDDVITWEFSVDDGVTWFGAPDIKNDPNAVLLFNTPGNHLKWRVTAYRQGCHISALAIRPWYGGQMSGILPKYGVAQGPNRNLLDDYPPITNDPMWQQWDQTVPRWWFEAFNVDVPPALQMVFNAQGFPVSPTGGRPYGQGLYGTDAYGP